MIRVAVVENESELRHYGYANTVSKLNNIFVNKRKEFTFVSYTSANIFQLFNSVENGLMSYDALFVSSNVFNDLDMLIFFRNSKDLICKFVAAGKGIFIGYQKKLNIESKYYIQKDLIVQREKIIQKYKIDFLPEEYAYYMCEALTEISTTDADSGGTTHEKVKIETKKSSNGAVLAADYDDILLVYPKKINERDILSRCLNNEFNKHVYKSYLSFFNSGAYKVVLHDHANLLGLDFYPLLACAIPKNNERIVISTIVLDWENQEDLLENIIEYITKGIPKIAFVKGVATDKNKSFDFLIDSMRESKLACHVYENSDVPLGETQYHDIYCFSPTVSIDDVKTFWKKIRNDSRSIRLYHFGVDSSLDDLVMTCYSNNGMVDSVITKARLWFKQDFEKRNNGMWGGFWNTYDVLVMFRCIDEDAKSYLERVREAIRPRQDATTKSYDNVFGCTLGLLTLLLLYYVDDDNEFQDITQYILPWIESKVRDVSIYEKLSYWLTFQECRLTCYNISKKSNALVQTVLGSDTYIEIGNVLKSLIASKNGSDDETDGDSDKSATRIDMKNASEIEISRWIQFVQLSGMDDSGRSIHELLKILFGKRDPEGKWANVSRTGSVLTSLLMVFDEEQMVKLRLNELIEPSLNFLFDSFDEQEGAWSENKQQGIAYNLSCSATAHAIQALYLYNSVFPFTAKDFINIMRNEVATSCAVGVINSTLKRLTDISERYRKKQEELSEVERQLVDVTISMEENSENARLDLNRVKDEAERNRKIDRNTYRKRLHTTMLVIVALAAMVIEQLIIILENDLVNKLGDWAFTLITTIVGFGVSVLLQRSIEAKLFPTDSEIFDKNGDKTKKKKQKNKKIKK